MRTLAVLVVAALGAATLGALSTPTLASLFAAAGGLLVCLSFALTARRWGRPVRRLRRDGVPSVRALLRDQQRFATLEGTIVDTGGDLRAPVSGQPAAGWRLTVQKGRRVLWSGHEGEALRLSDGTGLAAVELPRWLVFSGEEAPRRLTEAGTQAEHLLRERFGARAERWFADPRVTYIESVLAPGARVVVFGKVMSFGTRPLLSPRAIAVDGDPQSLVRELAGRSRSAWLWAALAAGLLATALGLAHQAGHLPLSGKTVQRAQHEYERLLAR